MFFDTVGSLSLLARGLENKKPVPCGYPNKGAIGNDPLELMVLRPRHELGAEIGRGLGGDFCVEVRPGSYGTVAQGGPRLQIPGTFSRHTQPRAIEDLAWDAGSFDPPPHTHGLDERHVRDGQGRQADKDDLHQASA